MASWETGAKLEKEEHTQERLVKSREWTSTSIKTEEEPMCPQEERINHPATPLGVNSLRVPRTSEEIWWAVGQSRMKDLCEKNMWVEELIPQTGITRTKEKLNPATRTGRKFQSLKQQIWMIKWDIHGIEQQWPQRSSPSTGHWRRFQKVV